MTSKTQIIVGEEAEDYGREWINLVLRVTGDVDRWEGVLETRVQRWINTYGCLRTYRVSPSNYRVERSVRPLKNVILKHMDMDMSVCVWLVSYSKPTFQSLLRMAFTCTHSTSKACRR